MKKQNSSHFGHGGSSWRTWRAPLCAAIAFCFLYGVLKFDLVDGGLILLAEIIAIPIVIYGFPSRIRPNAQMDAADAPTEGPSKSEELARKAPGAAKRVPEGSAP